MRIVLSAVLSSLLMCGAIADDRGIFMNWNLGLDAARGTQRNDAVLEVLERSQPMDAVCLTGLWGGASRFKKYLELLGDKYPYWLSTVPVDYLTQDDDLPLTYQPPCSHGLNVTTFYQCAYGCGGANPCQLSCLRQQYADEDTKGSCWGCLWEQAILVQTYEKTVNQVANVCSTNTTQPWNWTYQNLLLSKHPINPVAVGSFDVNPILPTGYLLGSVPALGDLLLGCSQFVTQYFDPSGTLNSQATAKFLEILSTVKASYPNQILMGDYQHGPAVPAQNVEAVALSGYLTMTSNGYSSPYVTLDGECILCPDNIVARSVVDYVEHTYLDSHIYVSTFGSGMFDFSEFKAERAYLQNVSIVKSQFGVVGTPPCIERNLSNRYAQILSIFGKNIHWFHKSVNTCE